VSSLLWPPCRAVLLSQHTGGEGAFGRTADINSALAAPSCHQQSPLACKREQSSIHQWIISSSWDRTCTALLLRKDVVLSCQGLEPRTESPACPGCQQPVHPWGVSPSCSPTTPREHKAVLGPIYVYSLPALGACRLQEPSRNQCPCRNKQPCLPTRGCVTPQVPVCSLDLSPSRWDVPQAPLLCSYPSTRPLATASPPHPGLRVAVTQAPLAYTAVGNSQLPRRCTGAPRLPGSRKG